MKPCGMSTCDNWHNNPLWCDDCTTTAPARKPTRAYDALPEQVRGIGIVTTRRILVHRPKSIRRSTPVNIYTDFSYSDMRDSAELDRRIPRSTDHGNTRTVADVNAERRARLTNLLSIAGTLGENDRD